jgi:hypothetical protein
MGIVSSLRLLLATNAYSHVVLADKYGALRGGMKVFVRIN